MRVCGGEVGQIAGCGPREQEMDVDMGESPFPQKSVELPWKGIVDL